MRKSGRSKELEVQARTARIDYSTGKDGLSGDE